MNETHGTPRRAFGWTGGSSGSRSAGHSIAVTVPGMHITTQTEAPLQSIPIAMLFYMTSPASCRIRACIRSTATRVRRRAVRMAGRQLLCVTLAAALFSPGATVTVAENMDNQVPGIDSTAVNDRPWRDALCCGPNALYIFLRCHGYELSYTDLREQIDTTSRGSSFADLKQAAEHFGGSVEIVQTDLEAIKRSALPVIVLLDSFQQQTGHFTVVVDANEAGVVLLDPLSTLTTRLDNAAFQRLWSSYALVPRANSPTMIIAALGLTAVIATAAAIYRKYRKMSVSAKTLTSDMTDGDSMSLVMNPASI